LGFVICADKALYSQSNKSLNFLLVNLDYFPTNLRLLLNYEIKLKKKKKNEGSLADSSLAAFFVVVLLVSLITCFMVYVVSHLTA